MDCNCLFDTRLKVIVGADVFISVRFFFRTIKGFFSVFFKLFEFPRVLNQVLSLLCMYLFLFPPFGDTVCIYVGFQTGGRWEP